MAELLLLLFAIVVAWLVLLSAAVGLGLWALGRHNRVSAAHPTPAPLSWVWSPSSPARLHRRLRTAAGWVEPPPGEHGHDHLRDRLVTQAVTLDHQVVRASGAPRRQRRPLLRDLRGEVAEVERLAVRVHGLSRPADAAASGWSGTEPTVAQHLADLRHHLDLLDAAHAELTDVERFAGLGDPPDLPVTERRTAPVTPAVVDVEGREDQPRPATG